MMSRGIDRKVRLENGSLYSYGCGIIILFFVVDTEF